MGSRSTGAPKWSGKREPRRAVKAGHGPPAGEALRARSVVRVTSWKAKPVRASWSSPVLPGRGCVSVRLQSQQVLAGNPKSGVLFSYPMSRGSGQRARNSRSAATLAQGDARLPQHSVDPCLLSGVRNMGSDREPTAQSADWPDLCAPLRQSPAGAVRTTQVLAIVSEPQFQPEILRRITGRVQSGLCCGISLVKRLRLLMTGSPIDPAIRGRRDCIRPGGINGRDALGIEVNRRSARHPIERW